MSYDPTAFYLSVRSYTQPQVDILQGGLTIKSFFADTVDKAKERAKDFAKEQGLPFPLLENGQ